MDIHDKNEFLQAELFICIGCTQLGHCLLLLQPLHQALPVILGLQAGEKKKIMEV